MPLDIDFLMRIDENVADGRVFEQRFERPQARQLIENFLRKGFELLGVEQNSLGFDVFRDELADLAAQSSRGQPLQRRQVQIVDELAMEAHLSSIKPRKLLSGSNQAVAGFRYRCILTGGQPVRFLQCPVQCALPGLS